MKIAFRNFLTTLKRYKTASMLNIVGLTLAFMALYILISQVIYDVSYNRSIKEYEQIYLPTDLFRGERSTGYNRFVMEYLIDHCPEVETGGTVMTLAKSNEDEQHIWVQRAGHQLERFTGVVYPVSMSFLDTFSYKAVEGDLQQMERPNTVIISRSEAKRLGIGVGDLIFVPDIGTNFTKFYADKGKKDDAPEVQMEVVGIFEDFAVNSVPAKYKILRNIGVFATIGRDIMGANMFAYFLKLRPNASMENLKSVYRKAVEENNKLSEWPAPEEELNEMLDAYSNALDLLPISELYYTDISQSSWFEHGSRTTMKILLVVVALVVIMAFINFINFFFALIPVRMRTVNVSKVFGASVGELRWSFLFEAIGLVLCAILLALYFGLVLSDFSLSGYISCSLNPVHNLLAVAIILAIGVAMAVAVALYPAWYITSFSPSLAAKGRFAGSVKGRKIRLGLICMQFVISMALIIVTLFVGLQYRYMVNYDLGFDTENLVSFKISNNVRKHKDVFIQRLEQHSGISRVGSTDVSFFVGFTYWVPTELRATTDAMTEGKINHRGFSIGMFEILGAKLIEGEWLEKPNSYNDVVIDRRLAEKFNLKIGDPCVLGRVKGVIENIGINNVGEPQLPSAFFLSDKDSRYYYARLHPSADVGEVVKYINAVAHELDPNTEFVQVDDFSSVVAHEYEKTKRTMVIVGAFALVAIVISLMGVFGIVLFETQHRRREIAIRKVFGSTTSGLLWLLNSRYAKIVCTCFVVAVPVAWWVVNRWLQQFTNRIPIYWWVFAVAFILVMGITIGLVTLRSWRAANENPADVVKSE